MSDSATGTTAIAPASTTPKKAKGKGGIVSKKPRMKPSHPKTSDMVTAAIKNLKDRGGSSLQAIKKYISSNYKVDAEKMAPFIRKYLKNAVTTGSLVQTKGKGASGSFKLSVASGEKKVPVQASKPKVSKGKKIKPATVKAAIQKKTAVSTPKKAPSRPKIAKPIQSKAKKTTKAPTKKPKAPKPKKVGASKLPKRAAPKKK